MRTKQYLGNAQLKAAGVALQFTKEQVEEYLKCSQDPIYFIENYCMIVTLDHGLQPFKLYECQKSKVNIIHTNRKVILMEGRQQGKTTTSAAYILWYTLFHGSKTVAILANKATAAREVLYRYQLMYENLPLWLQQGVTVWNKGDIELENGSIVFTAATSRAGIRGKSCVTADTRVCVEDNENIFYVEIDYLLNNSRFINKDILKMKYTVYKITNKINNKIYVGFHRIEDENILCEKTTSGSIFADGYLGSGKLIKKAIEKYGPENFYQELLGVFDSKEEAEKFEASIVNKEFTLENSNYNIALGGNVRIFHGPNNGFYGKSHTEESLEKIKQTREKNGLPTYQTKIINLKTQEVYKGYSQALDALGYVAEFPHTNERYKRHIFLGKLCYEQVIKIEKKDMHEKVITDYIEHLKINSDEHKESMRQIKSIACSERFKNNSKTKESNEKRSVSIRNWIENNPEKHLERMEKINQNPEKIKKTAEKHRGMKRTEETKKNISNSLMGKSSANKGKFTLINETTGETCYVYSLENIPNGWKRGSIAGIKNKGRKSYTDGKIFKMYVPGEQPDGWVLGAGRKVRNKK
jgi:hypothetical protein